MSVGKHLSSSMYVHFALTASHHTCSAWKPQVCKENTKNGSMVSGRSERVSIPLHSPDLVCLPMSVTNSCASPGVGTV